MKRSNEDPIFQVDINRQREEEAEEDSMSEYRDENAESDEVDEAEGKPIDIKVNRLAVHDMNIKTIDKV